MTPSNKAVEFIATFPHTAGAIDHHGEEGTRIKLDISEEHKPQALIMAAFFLNKRLRVNVEIIED